MFQGTSEICISLMSELGLHMETLKMGSIEKAGRKSDGFDHCTCLFNKKAMPSYIRSRHTIVVTASLGVRLFSSKCFHPISQGSQTHNNKEATKKAASTDRIDKDHHVTVANL